MILESGAWEGIEGKVGKLKDKVEAQKAKGGKEPSKAWKAKPGAKRGIKSEDVWRMYFDEEQEMKDIAEHYGVTAEAIRYHVLKSAKLPRGVKSEDVWRMHFDENRTPKEIAEHFGVTVWDISYHLGKLDKLSRAAKKKIGRGKTLRILRNRELIESKGLEDPGEMGRAFDVFVALSDANEITRSVIAEALDHKDEPRSQDILLRAAGEVRRQAEVSAELLMKLEVYRDVEAALDMIVSVIREECDEGVVGRILDRLKIRGGAQPVPLEIVGRDGEA